MEEDYSDLFELKPIYYFKDMPKCVGCGLWLHKDGRCIVETCALSFGESFSDDSKPKNILQKIKSFIKGIF